MSAREWTRLTFAAGGAALTAYGVALFGTFLPMDLRRAAFFLFGPFLAIGAIALSRALASQHDSAMLRVAALLHVVAAGMVSAMAVIQNVNLAVMRSRSAAAADEALRAEVMHAHRAVDTVQLGLDVAFDIWLTVGALCLAVALGRHPVYGRAFSWSGVIVAGAVLLANLVTYPWPPGQAGLIDLGPALALWYALVLGRWMWALRWPSSR